MSAYLIFVIILTVGYIIYYGVTVFRDLNEQKKVSNPDEESFDLSSMEDDIATPVSETAQGFQVGKTEDEAETAPEDGERDNDERERKSSALTDKVNKIAENLEEADIESEHGMYESEFAEMLNADMRVNPGMLFREVIKKPVDKEPEEIRV